jgi:hypothetical protein
VADQRPAGPPGPAPAARGGLARLAGPAGLALAELGTGAALVLGTGPLLGWLAAEPPDRRVFNVARVLGTRYLLQGLVTACRPSRRVLRIGAGADILHGASMIAAAAADMGPRRLTLSSAAAAAAFAGVAAAQSPQC